MLALASSRDQYHRRAAQTEATLRRVGARWVGSLLVLAELHGHLIRHLEPARAARIIAGLADDPMFEWHDVTVELTQSALRDWVHKFHDQRFSLTDAVTFALMKRERVKQAFAYDDHFTVAGFELLA